MVSCWDLNAEIPDFRVDFKITHEDHVFVISDDNFVIHQFSLKSGISKVKFIGHSGEVRI